MADGLSSGADRHITLAVITGAHGVRGEVKLKPFTALSENLNAYGTLTDKRGNPVRLMITGSSKGLLIARIAGITDRNAAQALKGTELGVPRTALPETATDEYYIEDLLGLPVTLEDGAPYGTVLSLQNYGAGDIVEIRREDGTTTLLPFTADTVLRVDIASGQFVISLPEKLEAKS